MIRSEAERQFYLGATGIRLWYARQPLPGAAPSPDFEFPDEPLVSEITPGISKSISGPGAVSVRPARSESSGASHGEGVARIADLQALMEGNAGAGSTTTSPRQSQERPSVVERSPDLPEAKPPEKVSPGSSNVPMESLSLAIWAGKRVALIGSVSTDASSRLQEALALNILNSVGEPQPEVLGEVSWPIFNNLLVPGNSRQDFIEMMRGVLSGLESRQIVVLQDSEQDWLVDALGREAEVRFPHTLAELAGNPELKRSLWQQIRPLVAR